MNKFQLSKRLIDVSAASLLLVVLSPLLLLVSFLVLVTEGSPIFYKSKRFITKDRCVTLPKFRSMVRDAKSQKYRLNERFMRDGYLDIPLDCEVYTSIGRILERMQIVEIPQLWVIIFDGMSFVGNRPLPLDNLELLRKFDGWERRFDSPAGISGIAQVVGKYDLEPKERLELEAGYSEVYMRGNVLKCDLIIAAYTIRLILLGKGVPIETGRRLLASCLPQ